jgi:hypothetical protein
MVAAITVWLPIFNLVFVDGMKMVSSGFRLSLPLAYFCCIAPAYIYYGFQASPVAIQSQANGTLIDLVPVSWTINGQISGGLSNVIVLMASMLYTAAFEPSEAMMFPVYLQVFRSSVPHLLTLKGHVEVLDNRFVVR